MESPRETRRVLWPDGTVLATTDFFDGVLDGISRSFSMNGELRQERLDDVANSRGGQCHH